MSKREADPIKEKPEQTAPNGPHEKIKYQDAVQEESQNETIKIDDTETTRES